MAMTAPASDAMSQDASRKIAHEATIIIPSMATGAAPA
jgi:hypothetical protein